MGWMRKQMLILQRGSFEQTLQERLSFLSGKGVQPLQADKDTIVRKLKADIRAVNKRLRAVTDNEKRSEEMARTKANGAAPPKEEAGKSDKPKKASGEGKGKQANPEGGKSRKTAEPSGEVKRP